MNEEIYENGQSADSAENTAPIENAGEVTETAQEIESVAPEVGAVGAVEEAAAEPSSSQQYVYHWDASASSDDAPGKAKNKGTRGFVAALCIAFALALLSLALTLVFLPANGTAGTSDLRSAIAYGKTCTVAIDASGYQEGNFFAGIGSGFFISENGYIVTNYHVAGEANNITVYIYGSSQPYGATYIGGDAARDIAVIKISAPENERFNAVNIGDSSKIFECDEIFAIGSPESFDFAWTVTKGYVSCAYRITDELSLTGENFPYIQLNAALNPGNSGGPVFNTRGEVIGVVCSRMAVKQETFDKDGAVDGFVYQPYDGMCFAIPMNEVKELCFEYINKDMSEPALGVMGYSVEAGVDYFISNNTAHIIYKSNGSEYISNGYYEYVELTDELLATGTRISPDVTGIYISDVESFSGALGILKLGDIVFSFDKNTLEFVDTNNDNVYETTPMDQAKEVLKTKRAGDTVEVGFRRDGQDFVENIVLARKR